jgi:hypothetical protein
VPGVIAVKDCDRDLASIATKIERVGQRMAVLGGDDDLVYWVFLSGADGAIMASANVAPALCVQLYEACARADVTTALELNKTLLPLVHVRQGPDHPGPLKELMAMVGRPVGPPRRPLLSMTDAQRGKAAPRKLTTRPSETCSSHPPDPCRARPGTRAARPQSRDRAAEGYLRPITAGARRPPSRLRASSLTHGRTSAPRQARRGLTAGQPRRRVKRITKPDYRLTGGPPWPD